MTKREVGRARPKLRDGLSENTVELSDDVDITNRLVVGDLAGLDLDHIELRGCRIERARWTGTVLRNSRLVDCMVTGSDLSGVVLDQCSLARVEFRQCRLSGLQAPNTTFHDIGLFDSRIDGANFRMTKWERAEISYCGLVDSDFYGADLTGSLLLHCDLTRVIVSKCNLTGSHLQGSTLDGIMGGDSLRNVTIGSDQIIPAALAIFDALGVTINDNQ